MTPSMREQFEAYHEGENFERLPSDMYESSWLETRWDAFQRGYEFGAKVSRKAALTEAAEFLRELGFDGLAIGIETELRDE